MLIPPQWVRVDAVLAARSGTVVEIDGVEVAMTPLGEEFWFGSVELDAGLHRIRATQGVSLAIVAHASWETYAHATPPNLGLRGVSGPRPPQE